METLFRTDLSNLDTQTPVASADHMTVEAIFHYKILSACALRTHSSKSNQLQRYLQIREQ